MIEGIINPYARILEHSQTLRNTRPAYEDVQFASVRTRSRHVHKKKSSNNTICSMYTYIMHNKAYNSKLYNSTVYNSTVVVSAEFGACLRQVGGSENQNAETLNFDL